MFVYSFPNVHMMLPKHSVRLCCLCDWCPKQWKAKFENSKLNKSHWVIYNLICRLIISIMNRLMNKQNSDKSEPSTACNIVLVFNLNYVKKAWFESFTPSFHCKHLRRATHCWTIHFNSSQSCNFHSTCRGASQKPHSVSMRFRYALGPF